MLDGGYMDAFLNSSSPDLLGYSLALIIEILGAGLFYGIFIGTTVAMIGLKSRSSGVAGFGLLLLAIVFLPVISLDMHPLLILLLTISFGATLYRIFTKER